MRSLTLKEKKIIYPLIALVVILFYYRIFLSPVLNKISDKKDIVNGYKQQVKVIDEKNANLDAQKKKLSQLRFKAQDSLKMLPKSERYPDIVLDLKKYADANGVTLVNENFSAVTRNSDQQNKTNNTATNSTGITTIPVSVSVMGNYSNVLKYINAIEKGTRLADLVTMNITKSDSSGVNANLNLNYYFDNGGTATSESYDFNKGSYGKDNLFQ